MNAERMTERVREALNEAYARALRERNTSVEPEHVLAALLDQAQGIVPALLAKAGVDLDAFGRSVDEALFQLPRLTGSGDAQPQFSARGSRMLVQASDEAAKLKDDYASVEHLLLAMLDDGSAVGRLLRDNKLTRDKIL